MAKSNRQNNADDIKRQQRKQLLKTGIAALAAIGLCSWVAYRWFNPPPEQYHDFTIDSAVNWLGNADDGYFDDCRKNIVDSKGWFDWFQKDRTSLGDLKARIFYQKKDIPGGHAGMKRYELKFASKFSKITHPKSQVTERMVVETDGRKQFKVLIADYWLRRGFVSSARALSETDKQQIMDVAAQVLKKIESRDIRFFQQTAAKLVKSPDYFGWNKYIVRTIKKPQTAIRLFELMGKGPPSPLKFRKLQMHVPAGRTGFEWSSVRYRFSAENKGKNENFILSIYIDRDLYQNKSAEWHFYSLGLRKVRKKQE